MNDRRISRRTALKLGMAGIAVPTLISSSALGDASTSPASERVTLGHIGVGMRGRQILGYIKGQPGLQSLAVSDCFEGNREHAAQLTGAEAYSDFRRLLDRKDIDGVIIATPDHWHVPIALLAADAGKDVYVEKPLAICIEQDLICQKAFQANKRVFQYGTQQREAKHIQAGREIIRSGKLGKLEAIEVKAPNGQQGGSTIEAPKPAGFDYDMWLGPAPLAPFTLDRCKAGGGSYWCYDYSIGYLGGWGAHPLDVMVWCYDGDQAGPYTVEGTGVVPSEGLFNTVIDWNMEIRMSDGVKVTFTVGDNSTKFIGSDGKVELTRVAIRTSPKSWLPEGLPPHNHGRDVARHVANFAECIRTRETPLSNVADAVRSDVISHLCDIAVRTGEKITWDPLQQQLVGPGVRGSGMLSRPLRQPWSV
jgi:glucose-fructose oxidoreductase